MMNTALALQFLREHQPLPPDENLTEELIILLMRLENTFLKTPIKDA